MPIDPDLGTTPMTTPILRYLKRYRLISVMVMSQNSESYRNQLIRKLQDGASDDVLLELVNIKETIMITRNVEPLTGEMQLIREHVSHEEPKPATPKPVVTKKKPKSATPKPAVSKKKSKPAAPKKKVKLATSNEEAEPIASKQKPKEEPILKPHPHYV